MARPSTFEKKKKKKFQVMNEEKESMKESLIEIGMIKTVLILMYRDS